MIIQDTVIRPDGSVDVVDVEVDDNFFDFEVEKPIDALTQTQLAIAELAETQEAAQTNTQLALAELAELITGGVS